MLVQIRRFCAYCLARNLKPAIRWIPSELNNADEGSRLCQGVLPSKLFTDRIQAEWGVPGGEVRKETHQRNDSYSRLPLSRVLEESRDQINEAGGEHREPLVPDLPNASQSHESARSACHRYFFSSRLHSKRFLHREIAFLRTGRSEMDQKSAWPEECTRRRDADI